MLTDQDLTTVAGGTAVTPTGDKIGTVRDLYTDADGGGATFATVTTGLFGGRASFVPLAEASVDGDKLVVPYTADQVKDAPQVDADDELAPDEEQRLYSHYGLTGGATSAPATGTVGAGHDTSGPNTDEAMTRSEERLHVGTEKVQTGVARLRKYIVTENVTTTVPVTREEVRIEREPITEGNLDQALDGPALSEAEHEVVLTEERPIVAKETVPVERVRLAKETVTEEAQVSEQVAKEQIESDGLYPSEELGTKSTQESSQR